LEHGPHTTRPDAAADVVLAVARGAIVAALLDELAYLAQVGALAGFGRGRAEFTTGLALAALAGTCVARVRRARRARHAPAAVRAMRARHPSAAARPMRVIATALATVAGVLAPALGLHASTVFVLRPTACAPLDAFLVALLPACALLAWCAPGRTPVASFCFGMFAGYSVLELALLPALGWTASLALVATAWIACELACSRSSATDDGSPSPSTNDGSPSPATDGLPVELDLGAWLGAAWGVTAGAFATCVRPLLFQHVDAMRPGAVALVLIALLGLWAGAWLGAGLRRVWSTRWLALVAFAFSGLAAWLCVQNLATPADLSPASIASPLSGARLLSLPSLFQGWFYLGFPAVALGALLCTSHPRGAWVPVLVLSGICAGVWLGERGVLPWFARARAGTTERLAAFVRHPSNAPASEIAWNPDGIAVRFREASMLDPADVVHWQARPWERDARWNALERAEIRIPERALPNAGSLWIVGHVGPAQRELLTSAHAASVHVLDPLPSADDSDAARGASSTSILWDDLGERPCVVLLADPQPSASFTLRSTSTFVRALERRVSRASGTLWVWCDPSALSPEGSSRALSTWAEVFPAARLYLLLDGYAGPLIGIALVGARDLSADGELAALVACSAPAAACVASSPARHVSLDWPALEWLGSPRAASPTPSSATSLAAAGARAGELFDTLASMFSTPVSRDSGRVLGILAVHARAQLDRPSFQSKWERVTVPSAEVDAALALLREQPASEPAVRMVDNLARVLFEKREYDVVLDLTKRALELRPDVADFHRQLGRVRHELLDADGAIAEYELAHALDPASLEIDTELARIYAEHSRWEPVVALLEEVWNASSPPEPGIAKALGMAYLELGKNSRARPLLEFAREQAPNDGDVRAALDRLDRQKH
jgi:tetratricopeptide (TPR) repeat protein